MSGGLGVCLEVKFESDAAIPRVVEATTELEPDGGIRRSPFTINVSLSCDKEVITMCCYIL